jgi:endoglucanase
LIGAAAVAACAPAANGQAPALFPMRRGVNLGNALEAPNEGDWGYRIEASHLAAIAEAGFDGVRLPVRWDAHAGESAPYTIDPGFVARVAAVIDAAIERGLRVELDVHHYASLLEAPDRETPRFLALWRQIAERFSAHPEVLMFELLNEPNGAQWSGARLTELQRETIATVRESNPSRLIVVGPGNWNSIDGLRSWSQPPAENIAVSVHYYEPHAFTHQNAEWLGADAPRFNRNWGTPADIEAVRRHIARAADWARARNLPLQLGEFGVNARVPLAQRAAWTRTVREACEANGVAWCVWDFAGAFPVWDREREVFIEPMLEALQ